MCNNPNELKQLIDNNKAVLVYFSAPACSVCTALKPKIQYALTHDFPNIKQIFFDEPTSKEITSSYGIFSFPTVLVFFEGKEFFRESRNISVLKLTNDIRRVYEMLFKEDVDNVSK